MSQETRIVAVQAVCDVLSPSVTNMAKATLLVEAAKLIDDYIVGPAPKADKPAKGMARRSGLK